mmetsp:Transcript_3018/g.6853  ORF Transcript_3018/g.6853 Transcript_3018/m.6853 type:complete len:237 (-) Transcript_3018:276-986(-)
MLQLLECQLPRWATTYPGGRGGGVAQATARRGWSGVGQRCGDGAGPARLLGAPRPLSRRGRQWALSRGRERPHQLMGTHAPAPSGGRHPFTAGPRAGLQAGRGGVRDSRRLRAALPRHQRPHTARRLGAPERRRPRPRAPALHRQPAALPQSRERPIFPPSRRPRHLRRRKRGPRFLERARARGRGLGVPLVWRLGGPRVGRPSRPPVGGPLRFPLAAVGAREIHLRRRRRLSQGL